MIYHKPVNDRLWNILTLPLGRNDFSNSVPLLMLFGVTDAATAVEDAAAAAIATAAVAALQYLQGAVNRTRVSATADRCAANEPHSPLNKHSKNITFYTLPTCPNTVDANKLTLLLNSLDPSLIDGVVSGHTHTIVHNFINGIPVI